jgi:xanthine dehydrogenase accessory factor
MRDVLSRLTDLLDSGREGLLCQVVETKGSTPQKAGALMLVDPTGGQVGTLGGGCVENEVKQKAIRRLGQDGAERHTFVLDHDYAWADGLICGGKMVILAEAFRGPEAADYFRAYRDRIDLGLGLVEAVATDPDRCGAPAIGARWLFGEEAEVVASLPGGAPPEPVRSLVEPIGRRPRVRSSGGVAILPVLPRIRLVIVGAGHVGQAVGRLASEADFDLTVVDDRGQYAHPERFPEGTRLVVGPMEEVLPALASEITPHTFALVVTRGHGHDQEALFHLAPTPASYVGLIGSRRKIRLIFEGLRDQGIAEEHLARVTAPIGISIGSQTVPEIAVSVVAQLIARRNLGPESVPTNDFSRAGSTTPEPEPEPDPAEALGP